MDVDLSTVPGRYASALYGLAVDKNKLSAVEKDLRSLEALISGSSDLAHALKSPLYKAEQQAQAVAAVLEKAKIKGIVANFVMLVAKNRRLFALQDMIRAFRRLAAIVRGEQTAEVTSAAALTKAQQTDLVKALKKKLGGEIILDTQVDAGLIGGMTVKIGSRMVDASVKRKLEMLRTAMKEVG